MTPHELERHLDVGREAVAPQWDSARAARVLAGLPARARLHRRRRLVALTATAALLGLALAAGVFSNRNDVTLERLDERTVLAEVPRDGQRRFELSRGTARFTIRDRKGPPLFVQAGAVELEIMATRALVEVVDDRARVIVEEGAVLARWPTGEQLIRAGEPAWVPPVPPVETPAPVPAVDVPAPEPVRVVTEPTEAPKRIKSKRPAATPDVVWKRLAAIGDYQAAWLELQSTPPKDEAAELLLAADVARLSGHPDAAIAPLERVTQKHRSDARAALAAFTLGRVLLDDLGRPRDAMSAFHTAETLAPTGPLAEDALARRVEAASKAQHPSAHELAVTFLERYPTSVRARAVKHFGGVQ